MRMLLLALMTIAISIPVYAEDGNDVVDILVRLNEQPLLQITNVGGTIAAKSVVFTGAGDYLKQAIPPKILPGFIPLMKSAPVIVVMVNLRPAAVRSWEFFLFLNPDDITVSRCDTLTVPTIQVEYKDPKTREKGIRINLTMSAYEHTQSPAMLPAFTK